MEKPKAFDTARAWGGYEPLAPGGYVCRIAGVEETVSSTGKDMVKVALDIAEGEETGRFAEAYKNDAREGKKWPNEGVAWLLAKDNEGRTHGKFKQFVDCVAASNPGFGVAWGSGFCACFRGKLVGAVFGREQYEGRDGKARWATKPQYFKPAEDIRGGNYRLPEDRPLDGQGRGSGQTPGIPEGFRAISDEDIPF